jgi:nucleoid-associated protein YgaU
MSRYMGREMGKNSEEMYKEKLEDRGVNSITQFTTPSFRYPTANEIAFGITTIPHVWVQGDRFFKLAHEYYNNVENWWVIAMFNQKPTEAHVKPGEVVYIPTPLNAILSYMKVV